MKFLAYHRKENYFVKILRNINNFIDSTIKYLNKSIFEIKGRQVRRADILLVLLVLLIAVYSIRGIYKNNISSSHSRVTTAKVVEVAEVPKETWGYISFFEDNKNYLVLDETRPSEAPNYAHPYVSMTKEQKEIVDKLRSSLNLSTPTLTAIDNTIEEQNDLVVDPSTVETSVVPAQEALKQEEAEKNAGLTDKTTAQQSNTTQEVSKPITLTCGPFLDQSSASKYISYLKNSPRKVFTQSNVSVSSENDTLYWLKISGNLTEADSSWLQRYYAFKCN
ncbi:hypothetical protein CKF54_01570 [Psittacicella hinzii]|uniref:SPOR domain-containing protein n=1 Tax=Psittacicella hinzii TaxID=2028575 RepID=A0A3A1YDC8_9GAMM|nr:hypothetical protein [Psittacicella hinzii]RIY34147.1 hypothetical protein CKF54_01570 [Psittacicella hinzii]